MRFAIALLCVFWPAMIMAQTDEDRGFLTGLLERSLGGEGRIVRIDGFAGALSSTATIEQITIADAEGVWLTLQDLSVQWSRRALLRGAIEIDTLRAGAVTLPRLPLPVPSAAPTPEAAPFALPDLPASLNIGQMQIDRVSLGAPVLGEAAAFSLTGSAALAGGAGDITLKAARMDGPVARFDVLARYANDTRALTLDLDVVEAASGLISGLLDLPDRPSVTLSLAGDGALSDFTATLDLRTDAAPRLTGALQLNIAENGPMAFDADLNGDVTALFLPEYGAFFGPDVRLNAQGNQSSDGAFALDAFTLDTRSLRLSGQAALNSEGWPERLDISGQIADPDGMPVLLPLGGDETRLDHADLRIQFDADNGDALTGQVVVAGFARTDVQADMATIALQGTLSGDVNAIGRVQTHVDLDTNGLRFTDPAIARAVGPSVRGGLDVGFVENEQLRLSNMALTGAVWALTGRATIDSFSDAFKTSFDTKVDAQDLSAFADLAGLELQGAGALAVAGSAALGGFFDLSVMGETRDLAVGIAQADAVIGGLTALDITARRDTTGTFLDRLSLSNDAITGDVSATLQTGASNAQFDLRLDDAGRVTDAVSGPLAIKGTAKQAGDVWDLITTLSGPLDATADVSARIAPDQIDIDLNAAIPDVAPLVAQLPGAANLKVQAQQVDGVWSFETNLSGPLSSTANVTGVYIDDALSAQYAVAVPDIAPIAPGIAGPVALNGNVQQLRDGWQFDTDFGGPFRSEGSVSGTYVVARLTSAFSIAVPDVAPVMPGVSGPLAVSGDLRQIDAGWQFDTNLSGPYRSTGTVSGAYIAARLTSAFSLAVPDVAPVVPGVSGPLAVSGDLRQIDAGWAVDTDIKGPYRSTGDISAALTDGTASARYTVQMPNIGALVPQLDGAASVTGTAQQVARGFDIAAAIQGPSGTTATAQGLIASDGRLELDAAGQFQLGLANPFLEPRNIAGAAQFDLTIDGPPALSSVSGQITTQGARLAAPTLPLSFDDISGAVSLSGGRATLDLNAGVAQGGAIRITGPVTLSGQFPAQIDVALTEVVVADPALYSTKINGRIGVNGALLDGARIAGVINVGETNVQVPSSGISTFGAVPDITHIGATRPVMRTRDRAGLSERDTSSKESSGPVFPLDITISAPARVFIRGRGLDAEVGGALRLTGTSADAISTGQFDLIRGRLNILGKRFDLTEGQVQLQGRFAPYLRFVAETKTPKGSARIVIDGPADNPAVTFEATPEAPQDQVLALIFFGRDITQLSPFQALQLANAVANLAGKGGEGIVSRLRGAIALDDLDVSSDEEGNTSVRAGKYITDKIYTDVTVGGKDGPEVSLNIDLTPNITLRGSVGADSNTGIGIFIEKDY